VAIVHYWLLNRRGGEAVLEGLCRLLPDADLFTLFYDPELVSPAIRQRRITASFLNRCGAITALCSADADGSRIFRSARLRSGDQQRIGTGKGGLAPSTARHVCYCHTPMRYLWDLYPAYLREWTPTRWKRVLMAPVAHHLRLWDYASATRVDEFIANSENVQRRIWRCYRRSRR